MKNLGDTQWIFAKTAERKTIKELEKLFVNSNSDFSKKFLRWTGRRKSSAQLFLEWLNKLENFEKFFKIVD